MCRGLNISEFCTELGLPQQLPLDNLWGDNDASVKLANEGVSSSKSRHFARRIEFAIAMCEAGMFNVRKVHTSENWTDFMGKLVEAKKYLASIEYLMQLSAQVADDK